MAAESAPYYWLVCDHCGEKSTEDNEYTAWSDLEDALMMAEDSEWVIDKDPQGDPIHVCNECGWSIPWPEDDERLDTTKEDGDGDV